MTSGTTRLHISPFTPALLETVLNPSLRASAADISFHTLETFPENSYGYVNLPTMEAEKLKKKLNGSILKGKKMKVEEAKPKKRQRDEEGGDNNSRSERKSKSSEPKKSSKKRKGEGDVLPGHELSPDRHIKRGWTEPSKREKHTHKSKSKDSKSTSQRSKYTETSECLFKTNPPANQTPTEKPEKKKKSKTGKDATVVHEFEKTVKHPTFLRSGDNAEAATLTDEFVDGKGWVSRGGDVKEAAAQDEETKPRKGAPGRVKGGKDKLPETKIKRSKKEPSPQESSTDTSDSDSDSESSSSATSSSEDDSDTSESEDDSDNDSTSTTSSSDDDTSSSSSDDDSEESVDEATPVKLSKAKPTTTLPIHPPTPTPDQTKDSKPTNDSSVHPLEALFKVSTPATPKHAPRPSLEIKTQFSFFGGDDNDDNDDEEGGNDAQTGVAGGLEPPQTPFTRQDLRTRGIRSAAPTPDTAAPQRISFWENDNNNNDYDDEGDNEKYQEDNENKKSKKQKKDTKSEGSGKVKGADGSDFSSWFWENRGENSRAWKKRRREAAKEKRQRENRRKGNKGK
ncbi:hypothetical protein FQN54_002811 [Arachnomyces sp. PD_36]|nr:hypothetical protein FQN54_002811 [Arachnomyces sp. PD_36]